MSNFANSANIKQIESLPTRSDSEAPLQNVLSISTAGKNRYLMHFNSHHSLIQWTAGIRLAMFEHATLQEAYTGALIAGKGKALNNINTIMERSKVKTEDWARVRFGAGTPWRRCWCVICPPDEKEVQKLQKQMNRKKSAYDRSRSPVVKGDIKIYDTKKTKKVQPIATITDAYSGFAIYPQSKPLIDASTLVKVEGSITIHSNPPSTTEGFVFVMPEVHPAVTGFEIMLRWLFPVFDTFALYGRPGRLIADTTDPQSLMFAMPKHPRHGYLEILDVSGLIMEPGSSSWNECEWRRRMKDLTGKRMTALQNVSRTDSRYSSRRSTRNSFGPSRSRIHFDDGASIRSSPSVTWNQGPPLDVPNGIPRTDSAPPGQGAFGPPGRHLEQHHRSVSEAQGLDSYANQSPPSNYDGADEPAPTPPPHNTGVSGPPGTSGLRYMNDRGTPERISSEDEHARATPVRELQELTTTTSPEPVVPPPAFSHAPGSLPPSKPYHSPELRMANSRMSNATLSQLTGAGGVVAAENAGSPRTSEDQRRQNMGRYSEDRGQRVVLSDANTKDLAANHDGLNEGMVAARNPRFLMKQPSANPSFEPDDPNPSQQPTFNSSATFNYRANENHSTPSQGQIRDPGPQARTYDPPQVATSSEPYSHAALSNPASLLQGHVVQRSTDSTSSTASQPPRLQTGQNIPRKSLPMHNTTTKTPTSAQTGSSTGSLGHHVIDEAAFNMIATPDDVHLGRNQSLLPFSGQAREENSNVSTLNEDAESDYDSPNRPSIDTQKSVEIPRAGVIRTVGNVAEEHNANTLPISIDFGPTANLASDRGPRTRSPGPAQGYATDHTHPVRTQNPGPAQGYSAAYPARYGDSTRKASPGPRVNHTGGGCRPDGAGPSRSPNRPILAPEGPYGNESSESRTVAWQPGMGALAGASLAKQQGITAEQFVQQRAQAVPIYAHQRQPSANVLNTASGSNPPTPPSSGKYQQNPSRNSTSDLPQRPGSRGGTTSLAPMGSGDIASSLSAREQEHIARLTGRPLVQVAQNNHQPTGSGLVGAIETRERDRQQMRAGINSQTVQQAIYQRQQQAGNLQYSEQDYRTPQSPYGSMGQYPQQYPVQPQRQQQQWAVSPAASVYAQGGGFAAPSQEYRVHDTGRQSPSMQQHPQQQYSQQQYFNLQQGSIGQGGRGYSPGQ